jgi:hypothetical protein
MSVFSTPRLNALLGALVLTIGAGLAWDALMEPALLLVFITAMVLLLLKGRSIGLVWAWSTLLLGVECLAWPIITMIRVRSVTDQPSDEQMGLILMAVMMGLFSSVFWISFSYGLFKRSRVVGSGAGSETAASMDNRHRQRLTKK